MRSCNSAYRSPVPWAGTDSCGFSSLYDKCLHSASHMGCTGILHKSPAGTPHWRTPWNKILFWITFFHQLSAHLYPLWCTTGKRAWVQLLSAQSIKFVRNVTHFASLVLPLVPSSILFSSDQIDTGEDQLGHSLSRWATARRWSTRFSFLAGISNHNQRFL